MTGSVGATQRFACKKGTGTNGRQRAPRGSRPQEFPGPGDTATVQQLASNVLSGDWVLEAHAVCRFFGSLMLD